MPDDQTLARDEPARHVPAPHLFEGARQGMVKSAARAAFRGLPFRPLALAGRAYPAEPATLEAQLNAFAATWRKETSGASPPRQGLIARTAETMRRSAVSQLATPLPNS